MYKKTSKPKLLPLASMIAAVITNPEEVGYQARNLMPLDPDKLEAFKIAGQWDPTKPATFIVHDGNNVILDGNTRVRYAQAAGFTEGWFAEVELDSNEIVDVLRNRARSNVHTKNDPWTQADTFHDEFSQDLIVEEIAKNHGVSGTTVKKALRLYDLVKGMGPKPKAEETEEQTTARMEKAEEAQRAVIEGLRAGTIPALDIERIFAKELDVVAFEKALKTALRPAKEKKLEVVRAEAAKNLDEYKKLGVPHKFLPDLRQQVITRATKDVTEVQKTAIVATVDLIMGLIPLENFLKGDFTISKKTEGEKTEGEEDTGTDQTEENSGASDGEELAIS